MSAPNYTKMGCFFSLFMQILCFFGAETSILSVFRFFFRPCTHLKSLEALRWRAIFGVSYVCPKNYDFSERYIAIYIYKKACRNTSLVLDQDFRTVFFEREVENNKIITDIAFEML